jgi:hypothetical protein
MIKTYFLIVGLLLNSSINLAQTEVRKYGFEYFFKVGPIFHSFDPNIFIPQNSERHNRWDLELGIYDHKTGISILARYITGRSFINNPIFRKSLDLMNINDFKKGDLFMRDNNISNIN